LPALAAQSFDRHWKLPTSTNAKSPQNHWEKSAGRPARRGQLHHARQCAFDDAVRRDCGLAGGMDLPTSVAPFILRAASLLGIDSVRRPMADRRMAWQRLASDLDRGKLAAMTRKIGRAEGIGAAPDIVEGRVRGRIVVNIR